MKKNIMAFMFVFVLIFVVANGVFVSAEDAICPQEINLTAVNNVSGNISISYETRCVSAGAITFGISVYNEEMGGSGSSCDKLSTIYANNTYHVVTGCIYPATFNENYTYKMSATCENCTPYPAVITLFEAVEEEPECEFDVNVTQVTNESTNNIGIRYDYCGINESSILFGINVKNDTDGWGAICHRLNDSVCENGSCEVTTSCVYPTDFSELEFFISINCDGCKLPNLFEIPEIVEDEPTPVPNPSSSSRRSSGGGSGSSEICTEWSVCINGSQTRTCDNGRAIKTRDCTNDEDTIILNDNVNVPAETNQSDEGGNFFSPITGAVVGVFNGENGRYWTAGLIILLLIALWFVILKKTAPVKGAVTPAKKPAKKPSKKPSQKDLIKEALNEEV